MEGVSGWLLFGLNVQNQWYGPLMVNEGTADEVMLGGRGVSSSVNDTEKVL